MLKTLLASASFLLIGYPLLAAEPEKPVAAVSSTQQRFNDAKAFRDAGKLSEALDAFGALEADLVRNGKLGATSLTLVRAYRFGTAVRQSDDLEGVAALHEIAKTNVGESLTLKMAKEEAHQALAAFSIRQLDDKAAAKHLEAVNQLDLDPIEKTFLLTRRSLLLSILEPETAVALANEAIAASEAIPGFNKASMAAIQNAKGRALLNAGKLAEARQSFSKAISLRGGLDLKIDYSEFSSRSDAAIAELKLGNPDSAKRYLAYTGAGRTEARFPPGTSMDLPQCGGSEGLLPDDTAIIEFAVSKDGNVNSARPVIASRSGSMAYLFAKAVQDWKWDPKALQGLSAFQLSTLRVEVRCTTGAKRPSAFADITNDFEAWVETKGVKLQPSSFGESTEIWLANSEKQSGKLGRIAALMTMARSNDSSIDDRRRFAKEAEMLLQVESAPIRVRAFPAILARTYWRNYRMSPDSVTAIMEFMNSAEVQADRVLTARIGLYLADVAAKAQNKRAELQALNNVRNELSLQPNDPLRISALVALANLSAANGDTDSAVRYYQETGLDARQCAALDTKPVMLRANADSGDFPKEAMAWGFEGWTRQEYDIRSNGYTENVRTTISYPPAVFASAGVLMAKDFKYRPSFRPDGGPGCGGNSENIRFVMDR
jgi:outer membrane biosynthesis protein TonB